MALLHLRVVCPDRFTAGVQDVLRAEPGVAHLIVLRGAAVEPAGDVVEAHVVREAADDVLGKLCELGVDRAGGIALTAVDTAVSDAVDAAEEAAPGAGEDAVIWDDLVARSGEDSRLTVSYQIFLTIACLLAAIGAITDSPVTVVGAMVLGPEFGPLAAVAVGAVLRRGYLVRRGALALIAGFPLAMLVTAGATLLFDLTGLLSAATFGQLDDVAFIYDVGPFSLIVALLAGAAGMLSLTSGRSGALVGVFISVTTVPAAAFASVALVEGRFAQAGESAAQLLVNLVGIVAAGAAVLLLTPHHRLHADRVRRGASG